MTIECYPVVTQAGFAATLGVSTWRVRKLVQMGVAPAPIAISRYHQAFWPAQVRRFLPDNRPIYVVPAMLFEDEVARLELALKQSLQSLSNDPALIPSMYFDALTIGPNSEKALSFMAELERKTYKRFVKAA